MTILSDIQMLLDEKGLPSSLKQVTKDVLEEHLLVALKIAGHDQEELLEIKAYPQNLEGAFKKEELLDSYYVLQFQFIVPASFSASTFTQLSSSLHFFNRLIHCPGFELDELNERILYRYVWFIKKTGIDSFLLMQVIGNIHLCYTMFTPYIKEIAEGKFTLEDILGKVLELRNQLPPQSN
ncbi:MAG: hypothetical protein H0W50_03930 [Parachlamydiaceae bacterium]|nr:hypothetical protein [Parachlamydiaceae bacterium]